MKAHLNRSGFVFRDSPFCKDLITLGGGGARKRIVYNTCMMSVTSFSVKNPLHQISKCS